ncbi:3-oxoacyl-[acyl-carrier-protein] synthase [Coemansia sp. RSA 1722]|nr:3-oxoacyl-[acyl-carrier-protein] synthase [Coemansia sp. RSA 1722]
MSGSGPVKAIAGACATVAALIDAAVETIQSGKASFMIAGGVEDFSKVTSVEFASMGATSNMLDEIASGRAPSEMCRLCTSTCNGFFEEQGASVVTLMLVSTAIEMGVPIFGIVTMSGTATDKQGCSVPAPGKGVLTSARETRNGDKHKKQMSLKYRCKQLK